MNKNKILTTTINILSPIVIYLACFTGILAPYLFNLLLFWMGMNVIALFCNLFLNKKEQKALYDRGRRSPKWLSQTSDWICILLLAMTGHYAMAAIVFLSFSAEIYNYDIK